MKSRIYAFVNVQNSWCLFDSINGWSEMFWMFDQTLNEFFTIKIYLLYTWLSVFICNHAEREKHTQMETGRHLFISDQEKLSNQLFVEFWKANKESKYNFIFLWDLIRLSHWLCARDKNCESHFKHTLLMRWLISAVRPYFTPVYGFEHNLITRQLSHRSVKENKNIWSC